MAFPDDDAYYPQSSGLGGLLSYDNILLFTILLSIGSGFFILIYNGPALLLLISFFSMLAGDMTIFAILEIILTNIFAILQILSGYGIHKQFNWSRTVGIISSICVIVTEVILFVSIGNAFFVIVYYQTEMGIIALNVILLILLNTEDVKRHLDMYAPENEHTYSY